MITRCNQCGTKFEISAQLLEADDASVRCGECMAVFDARAELMDESFEDVPMLTKTAGPSDNLSGKRARMADQSAQPEFAIEAVDLETADTLVIDRSYQEDARELAQAEYTAATSEHRPGSAETIDFAADSSVQSAPWDGRVDPLIGSMDDMALGNGLEFEKTLALDGVTGIESNYGASESRVTEDYRQVAMATEALAESRPMDYANATARAATSEHNLARQPAAQKLDVRDRDYNIEVPSFTDGREDQFGTAERNFDQSEDFGNRDRQQDYRGADYRTAGDDYRVQPTAVAPDAGRQVAREENKYTSEYQAVDFAQQEMPPELLAEAPSETDRSYRNTDDEFNPESAREMHRHIRNRGGAMLPDNGFDAQSTEKSARGFLLPLVGVLLISCMLLYAARNSVAKMNLPEPVLSAFCGVTGCQLPAQSDVSRLELMRRRMYNHPTLDEVLVISVDLINRAPFPQPYPMLAITMTNSEGTPVANRDFTPAEYQPPELIGELLPAGKPVRVKFEIVDPAVDAQSFDLEFR